MGRTHYYNFVPVCLAILAMLLLNSPATAHDPLADEQQVHEHNEHHAMEELSNYGANLLDVRKLIDTFRELGDDKYLDEAWELLTPALKSQTPDAETLVVAAFVAQSRHKFEYAEQLVKRSLAINANNDEARLLLASIQLVRGNTEAAEKSCRQLRNVSPLVLLTCKGRVALANGNHKKGFEQLQGVLSLSQSDRLPPELRAWSISVAGDLASAAGYPDKAIAAYKRSLDLVERTQVRAALADVFLSIGDFDGAQHTLEHGSLALPLLVRRMIVAKQLGRINVLQSTVTKVHKEFKGWIANKDWLHAREMARFFIDVVDHPKLARRLALINIDLQKEPEDYRLEMRTRLATAENAIPRRS